MLWTVLIDNASQLRLLLYSFIRMMSWNLNFTGFPWPKMIRSCIPSHEYSLEGLMLDLELQYFDHLIRRTDSLKQTLMLEKTEGGRIRGNDRGWAGGMASPTRWTWVWASSRSCQVSLACCSPWGCKELDMAEQLMNQVMALKGAIQITKLHLPKSLSIPSGGNACLPGKSRIIAEFKT